MISVYPKVLYQNSLDDYLLNKTIPEYLSYLDFLPGNSLKVSYGEAQKIINRNIKINYDFEYKLNNFAQRCDDFQAVSHSGLLFAGCSFTFGEGLPYKKNWSGLLYDKIVSHVNDYRTIAYPGASIDFIISNIYKYIDLFGKPKTIFALFPDSFRRTVEISGSPYTLIPMNGNHVQQNGVWGDVDCFDYGYSLVSDLIGFCKTSGINIFWSTWSSADRPAVVKKNLFGYVHFDDEAVYKMSDLKSKENSKYYYIARDLAHPGIMYNSGVANIFMEKYYDFKIN